MELKYPMENQSWINFRLDAITRVVDAITKAVKADHKAISAAVFPGPSMARKMVRQDWGEWTLDAYYPMIYNKFYYEGPEWIGRSVKESVETVNGRAKIYAGLMFGDIKDNLKRRWMKRTITGHPVYPSLMVRMKNICINSKLIWIREDLW